MFNRLSSQASLGRFFITMLALPVIAMAGKFELPEWDEGDKPEKFALGVGLWPVGALDVAATKPRKGDVKKTEATLLENGKKPDVAVEKIAANGSKTDQPAELKAARREVREIPPGLGPETPDQIVIQEAMLPPMIEIPHLMPPIEGKLRDRFFKNRPKEFLIDPQQMLTEQKSNDVRRFLEYHAEEAGINIYLIVMGNGQKIPEDISLTSQHREWFGEMPTALVATTMGTMGDTQIIYGDQITKSVEKSALDKVYQHCLREAQKIENDSDQIEQLALELSIQLYWVSQLLDKKGGPTPAAIPVTNPVAATRPAGDQPIPFQTTSGVMMGPLGVPLMWWVVGGMLVFAVITVIWTTIWMWRRDSLNRKPIVFQELNMPSRLGGEFSGGGFIGMSYDVSGGE